MFFQQVSGVRRKEEQMPSRIMIAHPSPKLGSMRNLPPTQQTLGQDLC